MSYTWKPWFRADSYGAEQLGGYTVYCEGPDRDHTIAHTDYQEQAELIARALNLAEGLRPVRSIKWRRVGALRWSWGTP